MALTLSYAQTIEARVNQLLAEGNIAGAQAQAANLNAGGGPGVMNVIARINAAISAAVAAAGGPSGEGPGGEPGMPREDFYQESENPPGGGDWTPGGGGGSGGFDPGAEERDRLRRELEAERQAAREAASAVIRGILESYGLGSLAGQVDALVREFGTNTQVIMEKLRQTGEYRTRFAGLIGLQQRGITDVRTEADYITLETNYRQVFREAGLRDFLGQAGTPGEISSIAKIVGDYSLSVNEVRNRVTDAQRIAVETPQSVRDALQRYYNVNAQDLVAYSLDPTRTMNRINEKANAAILGGYAAQAGLNIGVGAAERVAGLAGDQDISIERVTQDVTQARDVRDATRRLAEIERGTLSDEEALMAQTQVDPTSVQRIRTLQSRERARFGGSSGVGQRALAQPRSI